MTFSINNFALIILSVAFAATFLTIFFFTYVRTVEEKVIQTQMDYITTSLLDELNILLNKDEKLIIKNLLNTIKLEKPSKDDIEINKNNSNIMHFAFKVVLAFLIIALLGTYYLSVKNDFSYKEIFIHAFLGVCTIAMVEFTFLTFYASKFISADVNFVKYKILDTLQKNK